MDSESSDSIKATKTICAFLGILLLGGLLSASITKQPPTPAAERTYSVGEKVAVIETGRRAVSPQLVRQFEVVLAGLSVKFGESEDRIAGMTEKAQEILKSRGINESLMSLLTAADAATPETLGIKYEEVLAAYLTLRCGSR